MKINIPLTIQVDGIPRPTLNSTGRPIHATEQGIINFWRWFGGSKAVDKLGRPIIFYHGTVADFDVFDGKLSNTKSKTGVPKSTFFFSTEHGVADSYAGQYTNMFGDHTWEEGATSMPVYLRVLKPMKFNAKGDNWNDLYVDMSKFGGRGYGVLTTNDLSEYAASKNKDSIIFTNIRDVGSGKSVKSNVVAVFNASQIKSAVGNNGKFGHTNSIIAYEN